MQPFGRIVVFFYGRQVCLKKEERMFSHGKQRKNHGSDL